MAAIDTWTNTDPTDASGGSRLDDSIRSFVISVQSGMADSFNWPSTETKSFPDAGLPNAGTLRFSYGSSLADYPDGTLSVDSYRGRLHHAGSTWSGLVGHASHLYYDHTCDLNDVWLHQTGSETVTPISGQSSVAVTFTTAYLGVPHIATSIDNVDYFHAITAYAATGFTSVFTNMETTATGAFTLYWSSEGTVAQ